MKFKKIAKVFLSCLMAGALLTGCGGGNETKPVPDTSVAEVKVGMLSHLNASEQQLGEKYNKIADAAGLKGSRYNPKFYDSLRAMQMGIESGEVQEVSLYKCVADYIIANNDKFELVAGADMPLKNMSDSFCFAVRKDDTQLKADLDKVIGEMKSDGTLDKLVNDYVANVDKGQAPPAIEIPMMDGAQTIKVGVTGDLPPLDYVSADGQPAGFNTAILSEIAKRLGRNVEVIDIESGARATALNAKQIDVIFWAVVPNGDKVPNDLDKPNGVEFSEPYFKDDVAHLKLKK